MLSVKTDFSFLKAYGSVEQYIDRAKKLNMNSLAICDDCSTWAHIPFQKECLKNKVRPIFGVQINVCGDLDDPNREAVYLFAKNATGLKNQYDILGLATEQFYYVPRVTWKQLTKLRHNLIIITSISDESLRVLETMSSAYIAAAPTPGPVLNTCIARPQKAVLMPEVLFPSPEDEEPWRIYQAIRNRGKVWDQDTSDQYLMSAEDLLAKFHEIGIDDEASKAWENNTQKCFKECKAKIPIGKNIESGGKVSLKKLCMDGARRRKIDLNMEPYKARFHREMALIKEKGFEDYFILIADIVNWAKDRMFVGPARGSSAGSLVCFLTGIVEVDPLTYGLLFERFIDINREDLPDIDIDFPDEKRDLVYDYIIEKYGAERVARIGTVSVFRPKSALNDVARCYDIPKWELKKLTDVMIERSTGDARANMAIEDTFEQFDAGKELLEKYPEIAMAAKLEGHPRHTGKHAAGVIVSNDAISKYSAINRRDGAYTAMLNKNDAESIGLLKIDALGLKTLSVIEDVCEQVSVDPRDLYQVRLDDEDALRIFQSDKVAGVFQFEGYAVRSLMRQMGIERFEDIVALTALARPGPLHCGGAQEFISRRTGSVDWGYFVPELQSHTEHTYGTIVYQEQVMSITRDLGDMSWQDVSDLRKAMSKSLGEEFFNQYRDKFLKGTSKRGISDEKAIELWNDMCTFGSWAFNLSHAVSYGLLSYWCAYLKSRYPLEFAVAQLRRTNGADHVKRLLRESINEGIKIVPFDVEKSDKNWKVQDRAIYGGILEVKGVGPVMAERIMKRREEGGDWLASLTQKQREKITVPNNTPWHNLNRLHKEYREWYENDGLWVSGWKGKHGMILPKPICDIENIEEKKSDYFFIGTLKNRNLRDLNETQSLAQRGGEVLTSNNLFLNLIFEDDTSSILCTIPTYQYEHLGKPLMEKESDEKDFLIHGKIQNEGFRKITILKMKRMEDVQG